MTGAQRRGRKVTTADGSRLDEGVRVPVFMTVEDHAAFKRACDGRPMAGVLRALAANFVVMSQKVGGGT